MEQPKEQCFESNIENGATEYERVLSEIQQILASADGLNEKDDLDKKMVQLDAAIAKLSETQRATLAENDDITQAIGRLRIKCSKTLH